MIDQILELLANAVKIAAGLPGLPGMIFVCIVALAAAILVIAKYFMERGAREKEAYLLDQKVKQVQLENLARMQKDAATALISNMDLSYKQDYEYFTQKIKEQRYSSVYVKIAAKFHTSLAGFIYDETLSAEERAARIILLIKPQ